MAIYYLKGIVDLYTLSMKKEKLVGQEIWIIDLPTSRNIISQAKNPISYAMTRHIDISITISA